MSTVIETLAPYIHSLVYDKRVCKQTIRGKELALRYFSALYGNTETSELKASDMYVFYENLKTLEKKKKNDTGVHSHFSLTFVYKVMVNVRAYITWLASNGYLKNLSPADVPVYKVARNVPEYLSKEELKKIMHFLEDNIIIAQQSGVLRKIYTAHFWRALVRMLYTS
jgi:site-specific recombinase XerD